MRTHRVLLAILGALVFVAAGWVAAQGRSRIDMPSYTQGVGADEHRSSTFGNDENNLIGIPAEGCTTCHAHLESATRNMRIGHDLECTFCHGGDPEALTEEEAHVQPTLPVIMDQTIPPLDYDLPYQRFVNPSNLRVIDSTCAACHATQPATIMKSMMATAAGHYSGGLYQNGVVDTKTPIYGTFAVEDFDGTVPTELGAVFSLEDLIVYDPTNDPELVSTHFQAVPSQACARCHLWSRGKGYRGAEGQDGVYRADGCAACHMPYDNKGLSRSADPSIDHGEPGHPMTHTITKAIPTEQCLHCHHRGARIGLSFTGRSQMPPRLPSGPGVPGTTDMKFNGNYHYVDEETASTVTPARRSWATTTSTGTWTRRPGSTASRATDRPPPSRRWSTTTAIRCGTSGATTTVGRRSRVRPATCPAASRARCPPTTSLRGFSTS
jgi:hypothetical protein